MRLPVLDSVQAVAEAQLCAGCGVCAHLDPAQVAMVDDLDTGLRPFARGAAITDTPAQRDALAACPGAGLNARPAPPTADARHRRLAQTWGPVVKVWEGHAADPAIRFAGSSGGAATALSLFAVEHAGMAGAIHTAARDDLAHLNRTVFSTTRDELLDRTGSRYAPASPAEGLHHAETADAPCVFVGKPCDVAAAANAADLRPALKEKLGLTIAVFCAGAPSTRGTLALLEHLGVPDPAHLKSLRYRGNGWPGRATAVYETADGTVGEASLSYEASWGDILQKHRPWRCHVCPDHTGEFADVAVGDPWHHAPDPAGAPDPGRSLVVARTARGAALVQAAIDAGHLVLTAADAADVPASQPHLQRVRGGVGLRLLACRLRGAAVPRFRGFALARNAWRHLGFKEQLRAFVGAWRRTKTRGLRRPRPVVAYRPASAGRPDQNIAPSAPLPQPTPQPCPAAS